MTRLLVDAAVLDGSTGALPPHWLDGFSHLPFAARDLTPATPGLAQADALLLRTVTRLPAALLEAMPHLRAVATLSSGTDHLDLEALAQRGIALHTGHGGNAHAVADWVHWALERLGALDPSKTVPWAERRVLLIGAGAVGAAVAARLRSLGAEITLCDPPRAEREPGFRSVDLDDALGQGPWFAVSLHVPLETAGPHPTRDLLDAVRLARCQGVRVLNAARGGVLDERTAARLRRQGHLAGLALDTFVGEPLPRADVIEACDLATPHIAGHSIEGKLRVARRAVAGLRAQFGLPEPGSLEAAVAHVIQALPATVELRPFLRLDGADEALRAQVAKGESFDVVRHHHRRLELPLEPWRA